ncbi:MAG: hypothetical protein AVDCRST_MAG43-1704, partial [uncultured Thermomicrobiales bacterium]
WPVWRRPMCSALWFRWGRPLAGTRPATTTYPLPQCWSGTT